MNFLPLNLFFILSIVLFNSHILAISNNNENNKEINKNNDKGDVDAGKTEPVQPDTDKQIKQNGDGDNGNGTDKEDVDKNQNEHEHKDDNKKDDDGESKHVDEHTDHEHDHDHEHEHDEHGEHDDHNEHNDDHEKKEEKHENEGIKAEAIPMNDDAVKHGELEDLKKEEDEKIDKIAKEERAEFDDLSGKVANLAENVKSVETNVNEKLAEIKQIGHDGHGDQHDANVLTFNTVSFNCPLDCLGCTNGDGKANFCKNKDNLCGNYKDLNDVKCEDGYFRCGVFDVVPNQKFTLISSNSTVRNPQVLTIQGGNMNPCVHLLVVPKNLACERGNVTVLEEESQRIVDPNFSATILPNGLKIDNLLINGHPGDYNICLTQYSNDQRLDSSLIHSLTNAIHPTSNHVPRLVAIEHAGVLTLT